MRIRFAVFLLTVFVLALVSCHPAPVSGASLPSGSVLFQDDFSDKNSGWLQGADKDNVGLSEYSNGGLRIYVWTDEANTLSVPHLNFSDVRIEVDTLKLAGPDDNDFGIICRYQDENNFYFLEVSSDGYYGIGKYKDNNLSLIGIEKMQSSEAIHQGGAINHMRADCIGSTLTLYVNDVQLTSVEDKDFSSGDIGLIAGTFKTPGTDVLFDNFVVLKP